VGIKKPRRPANFESVSGQPKTLNVRKAGVVTVLKPKAPKFPYLESSDVLSLSPALYGVFPALMHRGEVFKINLSYLLRNGQLAHALANALLSTLGSRPKLGTARALSKNLRLGFSTFLATCNLDNENSVISTTLINAFVKWLSQTEGGVEKWSVSTRARFYLSAKTCIRWMANHKNWYRLVSSDLFIPESPWSGRNRLGNPVPVIPDDLMTRVRLACMAEATLVMTQFNETKAAVSLNKASLRPLESYGRGELKEVTIESILAYISDASQGGLLLQKSVLPTRICTMLSAKKLSIKSLEPRFYPLLRPLVPFVLLMAIALTYNAETIRNSRLQDFSYSRELGEFLVVLNDESVSDTERFNAFAPKGRASRRQKVHIPLDTEIDNPAVLFEFVKEWTAPLRALAPPKIAERLFLFRPHGSQTPSALDCTQSWSEALSVFRKDHCLEHFTLQMIRPTTLDTASELFDGDPKKVQLQANHVSAQTIFESYTSDGEKQRQLERLGGVTQLRSRWRDTRGLCDPRDRSRDEDLGAATPGWSCHDPYSSPFAYEDELCKAYGRCPICPLAALNLKSPLSLAHAVNLLDAINRAQEFMSPESWLKRLGPVKHKLMNYWIPSFDLAIVEEAKKIRLYPMPTPE
jgi:hypothetical protein